MGTVRNVPGTRSGVCRSERSGTVPAPGCARGTTVCVSRRAICKIYIKGGGAHRRSRTAALDAHYRTGTYTPTRLKYRHTQLNSDSSPSWLADRSGLLHRRCLSRRLRSATINRSPWLKAVTCRVRASLRMAPSQPVSTLMKSSKRRLPVGTITGTKRGIQMFLSGADPADFVNGRAVRKTAAADERVIELDGENVTVFKGSHAAEDELLA